MKSTFTLLFLAAFALLAAEPAHAYIGPGGGLTAIGALLALIAAVVVTFFGFLWYPIKRFRKRRREKRDRDKPPAAVESRKTGP
jgi:hypothetical protein